MVQCPYRPGLLATVLVRPEAAGRLAGEARTMPRFLIRIVCGHVDYQARRL